MTDRVRPIVLLLTAAGEKRLAQDAEELAEQVEFSAVPFQAKVRPSPRRIEGMLDTNVKDSSGKILYGERPR